MCKVCSNCFLGTLCKDLGSKPSSTGKAHRYKQSSTAKVCGKNACDKTIEFNFSCSSEKIFHKKLHLQPCLRWTDGLRNLQ